MSKRSMDTQDTMPYEVYEGAYSQWREEDETNWDKYHWPPVGWRPNSWNQCYWDNTSQWHMYNSYDWDAYHNQRTPWEDGPNSPEEPTPAKTTVESDSTSPPATISSSPGSFSRSDSADALSAQLARTWTGDLVDGTPKAPAVAGDKPGGAVNGKESEVQSAEQGGHEGKEEKAENAPAKESDDKQGKEKPKEGENKENAKGGENEDGKEKEGDKGEVMNGESNQEQPGGSGGAPAQEAEDQAEQARQEELEARAKAAHARYMRYFRNVRSINLSLWNSIFLRITCTHILYRSYVVTSVFCTYAPELRSLDTT